MKFSFKKRNSSTIKGGVLQEANTNKSEGKSSDYAKIKVNDGSSRRFPRIFRKLTFKSRKLSNGNEVNNVKQESDQEILIKAPLNDEEKPFRSSVANEVAESATAPTKAELDAEYFQEKGAMKLAYSKKFNSLYSEKGWHNIFEVFFYLHRKSLRFTESTKFEENAFTNSKKALEHAKHFIMSKDGIILFQNYAKEMSDAEGWQKNVDAIVTERHKSTTCTTQFQRIQHIKSINERLQLVAKDVFFKKFLIHFYWSTMCKICFDEEATMEEEYDAINVASEQMNEERSCLVECDLDRDFEIPMEQEFDLLIENDGFKFITDFIAFFTKDERLQANGIFRINADHGVLTKLQELYNAGEADVEKLFSEGVKVRETVKRRFSWKKKYPVIKQATVHDMATLFKVLLSEKGDKLVSDEFKEHCSFNKLQLDDPGRYFRLMQMSNFLADVSEEERNSMGVESLSKIFSFSLCNIRDPQGENAHEYMKLIAQNTRVIEYCINEALQDENRVSSIKGKNPTFVEDSHPEENQISTPVSENKESKSDTVSLPPPSFPIQYKNAARILSDGTKDNTTLSEDLDVVEEASLPINSDDRSDTENDADFIEKMDENSFNLQTNDEEHYKNTVEQERLQMPRSISVGSAA